MYIGEREKARAEVHNIGMEDEDKLMDGHGDLGGDAEPTESEESSADSDEQEKKKKKDLRSRRSGADSGWQRRFVGETDSEEDKVKMPKGIKTMDQWGRTQIDYGRTYKGQAYADVYDTDVDYVDWVVRNRKRFTKAEYVDFVNYIFARRKQEKADKKKKDDKSKREGDKKKSDKDDKGDKKRDHKKETDGKKKSGETKVKSESSSSRGR